MDSNRLGVITFFGILVPGAYLAGILALALASILELSAHQGHALAIGFVSRNTGFTAAIFLFVSYLLGVLVRLFAPRYVDNLSKYYLIYIRRNKKDWVKDEFPYEASLTSRLTTDGMSKVLGLMKRLNPTFGEKNNTSFFNYCKWFIDANEPALSRQVQEAEALVRFLSGTTLVLLIGLVVSIGLGVAFALHSSTLYAALYGSLLTTIVIGLSLILERFKYQRRREVILVWTCVYMIANGGTSSTFARDKERHIESAFFPL